MSKTLEQKIKNKTARIAVVGLGYVGLPLAVNFAKAGYEVVGLDTDDDRVARVNSRVSYILDVPEKLLAQVIDKGRLSAQKDFSIIRKTDVIIICVPTPLKRRYTPDISYMVQSIRTISKYLKKDTLVVLESTTYPGTTEELIKPALEKKGKKLGRDFHLSFSPERIDPGNRNYDVTKIPKLVGGLTKTSGELTQQLYQKIIKKVILVSSAKTAEMAKLLENTFRIINIGWINEIAMMCHQMGINVWEVIEAAKTKPFGFMPFYPGLGVGGHCIPDDPLYLFWKARHHGFSSKYIKLSADINSAMPQYAVDCLTEALAKRKIKLKNAKILILGVTYKKDVHDLRKSPVLTLIELLQEKVAKLDYFDPLIPYLKIRSIDLRGITFSAKNISKYDCLVLAVDHTVLDYKVILNDSKLIYDVRNKYHGVENNKIIRF